MNAMKTKKQTTKKSRPAKQNAHPDRLKGWTKIAQFLGQPGRSALGQVGHACAAGGPIHDCFSRRT